MVLDLGSVCHLRTLVLGVDNDRIRPTPSSRAIGYAPIRYSRAGARASDPHAERAITPLPSDRYGSADLTLQGGCQ